MLFRNRSLTDHRTRSTMTFMGIPFVRKIVSCGHLHGNSHFLFPGYLLVQLICARLFSASYRDDLAIRLNGDAIGKVRSTEISYDCAATAKTGVQPAKCIVTH